MNASAEDDGWPVRVASGPNVRSERLAAVLAELRWDDLSWDQVLPVLPALAVLAGVAVTFAGNAYIETGRSRRDRRSRNEERQLRVFTDLIQAITDVVHAVDAAERREPNATDGDETMVKRLAELVGEARKQAAMASLVAPARLFHVQPSYDLIGEIQNELTYVLKDSSGERSTDRLAGLRDRLARDFRWSLRVR